VQLLEKLACVLDMLGLILRSMMKPNHHRPLENLGKNDRTEQGKFVKDCYPREDDKRITPIAIVIYSHSKRRSCVDKVSPRWSCLVSGGKGSVHR
jgi:hypothetical protein